MENMEISKELRADIEVVQNQLKTSIRNHQALNIKLKGDPANIKLQNQITEVQQRIIAIGLEQKSIIERLRKEYKQYQKNLKANAVKNGVEERKFNLINALNRARKQNIITRSTTTVSSSPSEESERSGPVTPEPTTDPIQPQDVSQPEFLTYFGLATHDVYKEMQNRRVERKRRSTANPQFLYTRGWDLSSKRRRNFYLSSNISPPNTRQSAKNKSKAERLPSPPTKTTSSRPSSPPQTSTKKQVAPFPSIPNLPSGLTIERVDSNSESKLCVECKLPGSLNECETCKNGFHISCYNRPLVQTPKQCPRCHSNKEVRSVGALTVPSGMSVSFVATNITEKIQERNMLLEKNKNLTTELSLLQDRHSELKLSLNNQKSQSEELLMTHQGTEEKIKEILEFITRIKGHVPTKTGSPS